MKAQLHRVDDHGVHYDCLAFVCPGCVAMNPEASGLHMLPVNTTEHSPSWSWNNDVEAPTVTPSILTGRGTPNICHSFLTAGVFHFLGDCTHALAGQSVPMPDLPEWFVEEMRGST